jgi:hypothetical protein
MNFKSLLVVGLGLATLGLSLPAHAGDTANIIDSTQKVVVTGNDNDTKLDSHNTVKNSQSGRRSSSSTGTSIKVDQGADIQGDGNKTRVNSRNDVRNTIYRR